MRTPPAAARTAGLDDPLMRTFQSVLGRPEIMSFGAGFMNLAGFDVACVRSAFAAALADAEAPFTLQYGLAEGSARLRAAIVERMAAIEMSCSPEEIVVTTGATQALGLLCNALIDAGDVVLVERPTYVMPLKRFELAQARVVSVPGDEDGLDPLALETAVLEYRPKVIYTIPTFQNPWGENPDRRAARGRHGDRRAPRRVGDRGRPLPRAPLYERAAAGADRPPLARVRDLHRNARKDGRPGAASRVGGGPRRGRRHPQAGQAGDGLQHLDRRSGGIGAALPDGSTFTRPRGGVFVWAELPAGWSARALLDIAVEQGIFFMLGSVSSPTSRTTRR